MNLKQMFQYVSACSSNNALTMINTSEKKINQRILLATILILGLFIPIAVAQPRISSTQKIVSYQKYVIPGETLYYTGKTTPDSNITLIAVSETGYIIRAKNTSSTGGNYQINLIVPNNAMLGRYTVKLFANRIQIRQEIIIVSRMKLDTVYQNLLQNNLKLLTGMNVYFKQKGELIPSQLRNELQIANETIKEAQNLWERDQKTEGIKTLNQALKQLHSIITKLQRLNQVLIKGPPEPQQSQLEFQRAEEYINKLNRTLINLKKRGITSWQAKQEIQEIRILIENARGLREQNKFKESNQLIVQAAERYREALKIVNANAIQLQQQLKKTYTERLLTRVQTLETAINQLQEKLSPSESLQAQYALNIITDAELSIQTLKERIKTGNHISLMELVKAQNKIEEAIAKFQNPIIREQLKTIYINEAISKSEQYTDSNQIEPSD